MSETYARLMAMAEDAEVPGKSARDRMKYLVDLFDRHGLGIMAKPARPTDKPMEHC